MTDVTRNFLDRAGWAFAALLAGLCLQSIYHEHVGLGPMLGASAFALVAAFRPFDALLLLAALGPLAKMVFLLTKNGPVDLDFAETVTLAFLAGSAARRAASARPLRVSAPVRWSATILIAAALASGIVSAGIIVAEHPGSSVWELFQTFLGSHYMVNSSPLSSTMLFMEGLMLLLVVADTCAGDRGKRDRVLRMMVIGAAAAAALNVSRIVTAAMRQEDPWTSFYVYFGTVRANVHFPDLNAAGSYFAMMLLVAIGFAARAPVVAALGTPVIAAALWIAGSRTALAAALIAGCVAGILTMRSRSERLKTPVAAIAVVVVLAIVALAAWRFYPAGRNEVGGAAFAYRVLMAKAALTLTSTHPTFGVGLGRFYSLSGQTENAHNNFLQVVAELGVPGLVLFVALIVFALREAWRARGAPGPSWGLLAGLAAFLLTCLGGHPLLMPGAAYPFWMALGLAAVPSGVVPPMTRRARLAAICVALTLAATLPFRIAAAVREANVEQASIGFSRNWLRQPDGLRYRWAGGQSTIFVVSSARAVRIPLRSSPGAASPLEIRILLDGREVDRVRLEEAQGWRTVRVLLPPNSRRRFTRVDLQVELPGAGTPLTTPATGTSGVLMVGQPLIE